MEFLLRVGASVPIREFTDANGVTWKVWSTVPFTAGVLGSMRGGWLTFDAVDSRRRLVPIPDGWEQASLANLREYCLRAQPLGRTPVTGQWRIDKGDR